MNIVVTGATGFIGRSVAAALAQRGDSVTAVTRDPARAAAALPSARCLALTDDAALGAALATADAVLNLAGEPIFDQRWTAARKTALVRSRLDTTARVVAHLAHRNRPLPVLVSASAVGYYGDAGDALCDEQHPAGNDFAAELCRDWEAAATAAGPAASRIALARLGIVLGEGGGALAAMLPTFRAGLGGRIGTGRQWMPWIHLADATAALLAMIDGAALAGPVNVVAPTPVTNAELAAELGRALGRPARLPAPAFALRLALGERAQMLLGGQRAVPRALERAGFGFRFVTLRAALGDVLG